MSQYKMAAEGKKLDGGMGYDQVGPALEHDGEGMGYSMGGGDATKDGGMSYSMGATERGGQGQGMKYEESNVKGKIERDGYTQNGR